MKSIAFITPRDPGWGFRLAGVKQYLARAKDLRAILEEIVHRQDTDLVAIDERLLTAGNEEIVNMVEKRWHGIILVLPSPEEARPEVEDFAVRLMRRAIGYHVRLGI
jgi:V/A-type H+-transporting ATPase subunit F